MERMEEKQVPTKLLERGLSRYIGNLCFYNQDFSVLLFSNAFFFSIYRILIIIIVLNTMTIKQSDLL